MHGQPLIFPPIGNATLGLIGSADVAASTGFDAIRAELAELPPGPIEVSASVTGWLEQAVQQANAASYRFDLRHLHGPGDPRIVDFAQPDDVAQLQTIRVRDGRGTAKLSILLALDGDGAVAVGAAGVEHTVAFSAGKLVVVPAYLSLQVAGAPSALRCLTTTAHGPAFR